MKKKYDLVWCISLLLISIVTLTVSGANVVGIELPDIVARILGIVALIALPFLAYSTVKRLKKD